MSTDADLPGASSGDLSSLSWVHDELRKSLEAANKALRRYLKEAEAVAGSELDGVDPAILRQARNQLHQAVGVLELVGMGAAAAMPRAAEAALQRLSARPRLINAGVVDTLERGAFALLDYLGRLLAGKPVSTLAMFPQYRAMQELAAASRIHPADLWACDWRWRTLGADLSVSPRAADADARAEMEAELLSLMRGTAGPAAQRMSALFAALGAGAGGQRSTLWGLAAAFFEAQDGGRIRLDVYSKRVASRLLAQLRAGDDPAEASDRLAQDLLFFCAQAVGTPGAPIGPRLAAVQQAYALGEQPAVDYENARLGRFDPALFAQARKRIASAKAAWSDAASGELARLSVLKELFALVGDSLQRLYPDGGLLSRSLQAAAGQTAAAAAAPPPALAMEVATALLYLDASLDDADFDDPALAERIARLALRVGQVRQGRDPGPIERWMEDLYRRVSDRQTMGSVVQELRASLSEVEKHIDQYFRDPTRRDVLIPVPAQLSAMRGVLSVLGLAQASQAVIRMRDDVDALANTEVDPVRAVQAGTFDHLADNLGALSFLIDMVSVQPQMAKSMFRFDPGSGKLTALMPRQARPTAFGEYETGPSDLAALSQPVHLLDRLAPPQLDDVPSTLAGGLIDLAEAPTQRVNRPAPAPADDLSTAWDLDELTGPAHDTLAQPRSTEPMPAARTMPPVAVEAPPASAVAAGAGTGLEEDAEMRAVFLDEAREVIATAHEALAVLHADHADLGATTTVRRAFHTLKGSSRMVGLRDFGEAAWACEQLYNALLASHAGIDSDTQALTVEALGHFGRWVDALEAGDAAAFASTPVVRAADAMRTEHRLLHMAAAAPALADKVPGLPSASDLEFAPTAPPPAAEEPAPAVAEEAFELRFDEAPPAEPLPVSLPAESLAEAPAPAEVRPPEPVSAQIDFDLPIPAAEEIEAFELEGLEPLPAEPTPVPTVQPQPLPEVEEISFDLAAFDESAAAPPAPAAVQAPAEPVSMPQPELEPEPEPEDAEQFRRIGPLRIGIALFNIYLNEADELSRRLGVELAEWLHELDRPVADSTIALAHSLAGSSATVGYAELSALSRALEHALERSRRAAPIVDEVELFNLTAEEIRRLLHQFAAGFLPDADAVLVQRLADAAHAEPEPSPAVPSPPVAEVPIEMSIEPPIEPLVEPLVEPTPAAPRSTAFADLGRPALMPFSERTAAGAVPRAVREDEALEADVDAVDAVDAELFPVFDEEANELLPQLHARLRDWSGHPEDGALAAGCMRTLHTLKGGARLAGAMRVGEMAHRLESAVQRLSGSATGGSRREVEALLARADAIEAALDALRRRLAAAPAPGQAALPMAGTAAPPPAPPVAEAAPTAEAPLPGAVEQPAAESVPAAPVPEPITAATIDWQRFQAGTPRRGTAPALAAASSVRVRAPLLDRLVNQAGEIAIARARLAGEVGQIGGSIRDLSENIERLRAQLREIELQGELQIGSRLEAARAAAQEFDPLEMDRFTRFQELTRMMAESVADVATVQRGLQRALQAADDDLAQQARLTRDMQDDLLRTRMVEFEGQSERLYRVVRQAAKESGKQVRLELAGGQIEVDRGVLERMTGTFEHLLRNAVVHGIESPAERVAAGKDPTGTVTVSLTQAGNEVGVEVRDDGAGLDLARIREQALALGLLAADAAVDDAALTALIFEPGFSTADQVTGLAGRGVGMDVVRTEVAAIGGRIETATAPGQGTSFRLVLPLTTAVTQVVMLRCGDQSVAVPSTLVEIVRRIGADELAQAYAAGSWRFGDRDLPFFWLDALLQGSARGVAGGRTTPVVVIRSADQRIALHVDEVLGNQEVVVKHLGPQLSRLPGLVGMTLLPSGVPALIYNPVALATLYGEAARAATAAALQAEQAPTLPRGEGSVTGRAPLVVIVDDSLTVRRVTQRLLLREGYRVALAKDGLEGLELLSAERPAVLLTDIEMPRMDGFDLVRNLRADPKLAGLPVIMITSRIAQKHRDYAAELGVNHYLGKPYAEDELLSLLARYTRRIGAS